MKITIEEINGVKHTVVTVNDAEVWELAEADRVIDWRGVYTYIQGKYSYPLPANSYVIGCALPPIPRHPTVDDAPLLHAYATHGLKIICDKLHHMTNKPIQTCHFLDVLNDWERNDCPHSYVTKSAMHNGERVEIAIAEVEK